MYSQLNEIKHVKTPSPCIAIGQSVDIISSFDLSLLRGNYVLE